MPEIKTDCPYCKKSVKVDPADLKYNKYGREFKCPKCGKSVLLTRQARGLVQQEDGQYKKRFRRA